MLIEDQRHIEEELERLEDAIAERLLEDPTHVCHQQYRAERVACPC